MYTGVLNITDEQLQEAVFVSDFFHIKALTNALDEQAKYCVTPSTVFLWQEMAKFYSLPLLTEQCERIQMLKFVEVVKHQEFLKLSKGEVVEYFQICLPYVDQIGHDVMLAAALKWMDSNESCHELLSQVQLQKCSDTKLAAATTHSAMTQELVGTIQDVITIKTNSKPELRRTMAYVTDKLCLVVDDTGQLRRLAGHYAMTFTSIWFHMFCPIENGFIWILDDHHSEYENMVYCSLQRFSASTRQLESIPGRRLKPRGTTLSATHKNKIYLIPFLDQDYIECYDFDARQWSQIRIPRPIPGAVWKAASIGDDLYLFNNYLRLYKMLGDTIEMIPTPIPRFTNSYDIHFVAVHYWLYIMVTFLEDRESNKALIGWCYNTKKEIWTNLPTTLTCRTPCSGRSFLYENKLYLAECGSSPRQMPVYNVVTDVLSKVERPTPLKKAYCPLILNLDPELLAVNSHLQLYDEDAFP